MDPLLRATLVAGYGEANVSALEAAIARDGAPMTEAESVAELQRISDEEEAARFAAETERDASMGDDANWPHV